MKTLRYYLGNASDKIEIKKIILLAYVSVTTHLQAQVYIDRIAFVLESIEEIDIGWMKMYKFTTVAKGRQLGNSKQM